MGIQIISGATSDVLTVDPLSKAARVTLYDNLGNVMTAQNRSAVSGSMGFLPTAGLDGGQVIRAIRVGEHGTQRVTSEVQLFHDAFETSTINTLWTQSLTTMTAVQATGVLTLNNAAITTLNTDAIITSVRQYPKYPRQPLYCRFRAKLTTLVPVHATAEMGFGAPTGSTAIVTNGAFFRFKSNGTLVGVVSYAGTEVETVFTTLPNTTSYYYYDIVVDDDFVRFLVSDSVNPPIIDQQVSLALSVPFTFSVSHIPSFARVYVDGTGGGVAQQLLISAHVVQLLDAANNQPWSDQLASSGRQALINPTTYAQTSAMANSAPAGGTPSNTAALYTTLGGEYIATVTAASENILSVFAFTIPAPYTFLLTGITLTIPVVSTVWSIATTIPTFELAVIANCASTNISTGNGQRNAIGQFAGTSLTAAVSTLLSGQQITWTPRTPILCLPGTILHIGWKCLFGGAVTTGAIRGVALVDGHFV